MYATMSKWWRHLGNAYEVKADMVCLKVNLCDPYLSALKRFFAIKSYTKATFTCLRYNIAVILVAVSPWDSFGELYSTVHYLLWFY